MPELPPITINEETFLREHCTLPALPEILIQVQNAIYAEDMSIAKVADIVSKDPALTAQILKLVNSAFYGIPMEISRLSSAVAYIGLNEVYRVILSISVVNALATEEKGVFNKIWSHSILTALCAKHLAKKQAPHLPLDEIWISALLHDVGKLVYLKFFPDHFKELIAFCNASGCFFNEAESHYGFPPSSYFGEILCDRWRLPGKIKKVCATHSLHDLEVSTNQGPQDPIVRIITVANLIAVLLTDPLKVEKKEEVSNAIMKALDLDEADFLSLIGSLSLLREEAENFRV